VPAGRARWNAPFEWRCCWRIDLHPQTIPAFPKAPDRPSVQKTPPKADQNCDHGTFILRKRIESRPRLQKVTRLALQELVGSGQTTLPPPSENQML
jgi:hypothetical protein